MRNCNNECARNIIVVAFQAKQYSRRETRKRAFFICYFNNIYTNYYTLTRNMRQRDRGKNKKKNTDLTESKIQF